MATVKEIHDSIVQSAAEMQAHYAIDKTIRIESCELFDHLRQGDVYLTPVSDSWPRGKETENMQLVAGNSQGSRHIAVGPMKVFEPVPISEELAQLLPEAANSNVIAVLAGPVLALDERCLITHPEHADLSIPAGTYQVTYQLDWRQQARVAD